MQPAQFGGQPWPHVGPASSAKNSLGLWALLCGLSPVLILILIGVFSQSDVSDNATGILVFVWFAAAILAIVLGAVNVRAAGRGEATNKGMGVAGIVLGAISVAFFVVVIFAVVVFATGY